MTQSEAIAILKTGANVFLTGEPGSGKTHTINEYVAYLRASGIEPAITASTGIAATHINGMTIHSWSGIGIRRELDDYALDAIAQSERTVKRIRKAHVLIIDEVSMLSARTLGMVDAVLRALRQSPTPFGGLQAVLVGDFFQLPPIVQPNEEKNSGTPRLAFENAGDDPWAQFAYASPAWQALQPVVCYLSEQHRQEDPAFLDLLSSLRRGTISAKHYELLHSRRVQRDSSDTRIGITKLFSHNADVDRINENELAKLPGWPHISKMESRGPKALVEQLKRGCLSPDVLKLKTGARVMFTKNNFEQGFVNGTTGEVVRFRTDGCPVVKTKQGAVIVAEPMEWAIEADRRKLAAISQVPLRLAWAITVHKSQGMSLDEAVCDLGQAFEYGQGYVALSRLRTLAGLHLAGLNERALEVHPDMFKQDGQFRAESDEARNVFGRIQTDQRSAMHENFIRACGGTIGTTVKEISHKKLSPLKTYSVANIRSRYTNAYRPWSKADDGNLAVRFATVTNVRALAEEFSRQPGAIRARLVKLGLAQ